MEVEQAWQQTPIEYRDRVYSFLHKMKIGEVKILSEVVAPENIEKFNTVIKYFIRWSEGKHFGFRVEFNNSYTKIKKFKA